MAYGVFNPNSILSTTVVMVLGSLVLFFGLAELVVDLLFPRQNGIGHLEAVTAGKNNSKYSLSDLSDHENRECRRQNRC